MRLPKALPFFLFVLAFGYAHTSFFHFCGSPFGSVSEGCIEGNPTWLQFGIFATLATASAITQYFTIPRPRWIWHCASLCSIAGLAYWMFFSLDRLLPLEFTGAISVPPLVLAVCFFTRALDDNPYKVRRGRVLKHSYSGESTNYVLINGVMMPMQSGPTWSLCIQDSTLPKGENTGWLDFSENVFSDYPVGSYYPRR